MYVEYVAFGIVVACILFILAK